MMKRSLNRADSLIYLDKKQFGRRRRHSSSIREKINDLVSNRLQSIWKYFTLSSLEPKIWQKCDRRGNSYWLVRDPVTGRSAHFASEQEVRVWLEKRYYSGS